MHELGLSVSAVQYSTVHRSRYRQSKGGCRPGVCNLPESHTHTHTERRVESGSLPHTLYKGEVNGE